MALNISSLREYIKYHPDILMKYLYEDLTIKRARAYDISGVTPGRFTARIFEPLAHLGPCCRIPNGTSNILERDSEVTCILDGQDYCESDLSQVLRDAAQVFTAGKESAGSIEEVLIDGQIAAFVEAVDILSFQGDKTLANDNLNRCDGLIKIAQNDGAVAVSITQGTVFEAVNEIIQAIPDNARKMGPIAIFVPERFAEAYFDVAMALNLYHYNPGDFDFGAGFPAIGKSGYTIFPTRALNGTNQILATPINNIVWFNSKGEDHNTLSWQYSEYHQLYYWRLKTVFGVNLVIPQWAVLAQFNPTILQNGVSMNANITNTSLNANITNSTLDVKTVSPLGSNGGILTTNTP